MKKYGFVSNLIFHYKNMIKWEPKLFWAGMLIIIPSLITTVSGSILPTVVVYGLEEQWDIYHYIVILLAIIFIIWFFGIIEGGLKAYCENYDFIYRMHYMELYAKKKMDIDYEILEDNKTQELASQAHIAVFQGRGIQDSVMVFVMFTTNIAGILFYGIVLAKLNWGIIFCVVFSEVVVFYLMIVARKKEDENWPHISSAIRKMEYITNKAWNVVAGKDIRIFNLQEWLLKKYENALKDMEKKSLSTQNWFLVGNVSEVILRFLQNFIAYFCLLKYYEQGLLTPSEFLFYIAAINTCSGYLNGMLRNINTFGTISQYFRYLRNFLDIETKWERFKGMGEKKLEKLTDGGIKIEFKNVTYSYPNADQPILKNFNLTIESGETLAVLGLNGAGKSTIVKLLCGFYQPQEGEILINGINRKCLSREEYYSLISVVFQDYTFLPLTLAENMGGKTVDKERMEVCLKQAGFWERYLELPMKEKTLLIKDINEFAMDFSGGEKQKILFARALYKDAPIMILDEPTAALDAVAENELYLGFKNSTKGKTVLFISHRLSSTTFCDRVVLIENGKIIEEGSHEELMRKKGKYYTLFEIQRKPYVNEEE